ncbi:MAG: hypothetical protein RL334_1081, partial [Chloroflexota bacterium]
MDTGLLWFDNSAQPRTEKVAAAAAHYERRFGERPNVCYMHPEMLDTSSAKQCALQLRGATHVLRHHLWIGIESRQRAAGPVVNGKSTRSRAK